MEFPAQEIKVHEIMLQLRSELERSLADRPDAAPVPVATDVTRVSPMPRVEIEHPELEPLPRPAPPPPPIEPAERYQIREFLDHHDEDFVRCAYIGILRRAPDPEGKRFYLTGLREGSMTKVEILGRLRYSSEGRKRGVKVASLWLPAVARRVYQVPIVGYLIRLITAWVRLPITLAQLPRLEAFVAHRAALTNEFLDEALRRIESNQRVSQGSSERALSSLRDELLERMHEAGQLSASCEDIEQLGEVLEGVRSGAEDRVSALSERVEQVFGEVARSEQVSSLAERVDAVAQRSADRETLARLRDELREELGQEASALRTRTEERIAAVAGGMERLGRESAQVDEVARVGSHLAEIAERLQALSTVAGEIPALRSDREAIGEEIRSLRAEISEMAALSQRLEPVERQVQAHRIALADDRRRLDLLLTEARKRLPKPFSKQQVVRFSEEKDHVRDAMYSSLEDRFRGTRDEISQRLAVYLPIAEKAWTRCHRASMVDLGCGRGEWLEHASNRGWPVRGIDTNRVMLRRCEEKGLAVREMDALAFLQSCKDASLSVVTSFHLIEHLPFPVLTSLFGEAYRVLKPGGVLICETPNPENLIVGSCNFYTDPTHRNPLYPATLEFLYEDCGFVEVEGLRPNPPPEVEWLRALPASNPLAEHLNPLISEYRKWFHVSPDYACVGRKA